MNTLKKAHEQLGKNCNSAPTWRHRFSNSQASNYFQNPFEPRDVKKYLLTCALNEDSDQPVRLRSLIRIFVIHIVQVYCIYTNYAETLTLSTLCKMVIRKE